MKKIIALMLIGVLCLSMTGCGNNEYDTAVSLYEAGDYAKAELLFAELGDYKDSINLRLACRHGQAMNLYESRNYEDAVQLFKKLGNYKNSTEMLMICYYDWAQEQHKAGEYESAIELYMQAADYEDSSEKVLECRQQYVTNLMADFQYDKALPHLKALKKADVLDRHSNAVGWCALATQLQDVGIYATASGNYTVTIRFVQDDLIEFLVHQILEDETSDRNSQEESTTVLDYSVKVGYNADKAEMSYSYNFNNKITKYGMTRNVWSQESATATVDIFDFTSGNVSWENIQYEGKDWDQRALKEPLNAMTESMLSEIYKELDNVLLEMKLGIALRDLGFVSLGV